MALDDNFEYGSFLTEEPEETDVLEYGSLLQETAEPEKTEPSSSMPIADEPLASYAPVTPQQTPVYSNSLERDALLKRAEDPAYDDLARRQMIRNYLSDLSAEASGSPGQRPSDQSFYEEKRRMYSDFDRQTKGTKDYPRTWQEAKDQAREAEDRGLFPYETKKEYVRRVFQEELAQSNLSTEQKKKAFKELSFVLNEIDVDEESILTSPEALLKRFVYDTGKIKTGDSDVGDVVKVAGGVLNIPGGLIGIAVSSALAPVLSEKYYTSGEKPLKPLQNYKYIRNNVDDLTSWRKSGQTSDPDFVIEDYINTGRLEANDVNFKRAAEVSVRGKRLSDTTPFVGISPGDERDPLLIPFYSTGDVISITNNIADNEESIKQKISNMLLQDPSYSPVPSEYEGFVSPLLKEKYSTMGSSEKFKAKVDQIYNELSGVFFAEPDVYNELSDENKKYVEVFREFFPDQTESSKAYDVIKAAKNHVFGSISGDAISEKSFNKVLSVVPEEQRNAVRNILTGSTVGAAFTGGLHKKQADKRSIFNAVAVRYAQQKESEQIKKLAEDGGLGAGWRGDHISDPTRKKALHEFAHSALLLETLAATPEFQDSAESYFSNVGSGLAEIPHQVDVSVDYLRYVFGDTSLSKDEIDEAKAKWERDPVILLADLAAVLSLGAKAGKALATEGLAVKDAYTNVKGRTWAETRQPFNVLSAESLKKVGKEYIETKKSAVEILDNADKFPEKTFTELQISGQVDPSVDLKGIVVKSPETTISSLNEKINSVQSEIKKESAKPKVQQDEAKLAELKATQQAYERLVVAKIDSFTPNKEVPMSVKESISDGSIRVPARDMSAASLERVEGSFLQQPGMQPKDLTSLDLDTRFSTIESNTLTQIRTLKTLYKSDPDAYVRDMEIGQTTFDNLLRGSNIFDLFYQMRTSKNPRTSLKAVENAINVLYDSNIDDPRVWTYLQRNSRGHLQDRDLAYHMSEIRDAKYAKGVSQRQKIASPMKTIKQSTNKDYGLIENELESLSIGYELAYSGATLPEAYIGLNLTNQQIAMLIDVAEDSNKTAAVVEKITTGFNSVGMYEEIPLFETEAYKGAFVPRESARNTQPRFLPESIQITEPLSFSERLSRSALRTLASDRSLNYLQRYRESGKLRYPLYIMTEMIQRPFAFANIPGWLKNGREELLLWVYSNQRPKLGYFLNMFAKDSEILGKDLFYELRKKEGDLKSELNNILKPEEGFQITEAMIPSYFKELSDAEKSGVLRDFNKAEIHEYGSIIHRMTDAFVTDSKTGIQYKISDFLKRTADTSNLNPVVERNYLRFKQTNERARYLTNSDDQIAKINEDIEFALGKNRRSVEDLLPYSQQAKENIKLLTERSETVPLSMQEANLLEFSKLLLESYEKIDSSTVLGTVKDIKYSPVGELNSFQKSITILANEFVKPRRDAIFDEVTQIVTGKDTVRMIFNNNSLQTIVVRELPSGEMQVLEKFPATQKGYSQAVAYQQKTGAGTSLKSADEIFQDAYNRGENGPLPIKTIRAWERSSYDIVEQMSNYVSDYFDVKKTGQFIENEINNLQMGSFSNQFNKERLAKHLLSITENGRALLKESGYHPIRALEKALKLKQTEQVDVFGKPLSNSDRNFMTAITEKHFGPQELLEMYSDYQASYSQTLRNLIKTKHTLMLQSFLQSKGMILNNSQFNSLDKSIQNQFVRAENVTTGGKNVLPSTLKGAYINRRVATYFQRQTAIQDAFQEAGSIKKGLRRAQAFSKAGLLFDPINNSIAVNLFGAILTQAPLHGDVPFNPSYYKKTMGALKAFKNKEVIKDERLLRIIKTHSDLDTSVRRDVLYTEQMSLLDDFVADLYEYAGNEETVSILNKLDEASRKGVLEDAIEMLSLTKGKIGARTRQFLDKIKLSSLEETVDDSASIEWAKQKYIGMQDNFFKVYQYPDLVHKIAYQWQLEEMGYKPSEAYSRSMQTFVDYVDVAPYINFFRYGGAGVGGGALSPFTSDFITFSAAQVGNFNKAITNYPLRTFMFAQLGAINDKALEETLKLKMGIQRIRELTGDPTLQLVPGRFVEETTGGEQGEERDYVSGVGTYQGSRMSGVPAPIGLLPDAGLLNLLPLLPFSPEQTVRMLPTDTKNFSEVDNLSGAISVVLNNLGTPGNQALESYFRRPSEAKLNREAKQAAQEMGLVDFEDTDDSLFKRGQLLRIFAMRYVPRFVRSAGSVVETYTDMDVPLSDKKYKSQIGGELFGLSIKPFDFRSLPQFRKFAFQEQQKLGRILTKVKKEQGQGKPVSDENLQKIEERLDEISNDANRIQYNLSEAQFDEYLFGLLDLTSRTLTGEITIEEIDDFREFQMPKKGE